MLTKENVSNYVNRKNLTDVGISDFDINLIEDIYISIANKTGDMGSCVLGNAIVIEDKDCITSYAQGSIGIEKIKNVVLTFIGIKYPDLYITYKWGNMD